MFLNFQRAWNFSFLILLIYPINWYMSTTFLSFLCGPGATPAHLACSEDLQPLTTPEARRPFLVYACLLSTPPHRSDPVHKGELAGHALYRSRLFGGRAGIRTLTSPYEDLRFSRPLPLPRIYRLTLPISKFVLY